MDGKMGVLRDRMDVWGWGVCWGWFAGLSYL